MTDAQRDIKRKMKVTEYAKESGNVAKTCRHFGISRQCYFSWLHAYERHGSEGLIDSRPCPENHALRTPAPIEEKITCVSPTTSAPLGSLGIWAATTGSVSRPTGRTTCSLGMGSTGSLGVAIGAPCRASFDMRRGCPDTTCRWT